MSIKNTLIKKLQDKTARVAILDLGYVGLPRAVAFVEARFKVIGVDADSHKIEALNDRDELAVQWWNQERQQALCLGQVNQITTPLEVTGLASQSHYFQTRQRRVQHTQQSRLITQAPPLVYSAFAIEIK